MIQLINISKSYAENIILNNINLNFKAGKFYAVVGKSGIGKTTLMNLISMIDIPTDGEIIIDNINVATASEKERVELRRENIGMVFQSFLLCEDLNARENIILPLLVKNNNLELCFERADILLEKLDILSCAELKPSKMSGGQQQRVAIARSLINNTKIILADEPTGNLDAENEIKILELLKTLSEQGHCVIMVSHSDKVKNYSDCVLELTAEGAIKYGEW